MWNKTIFTDSVLKLLNMLLKNKKGFNLLQLIDNPETWNFTFKIEK